MHDLLDMTMHDGEGPAAAAQAEAARLAILQQPSALPALRQLLLMHGTALPDLAATLLLLLAAAGEQAAQQVAAQPGMLPALARLLQPSSLDSLDHNYALETCFRLSQHSAAAQRMAAEPAVAAGLLRVLHAGSAQLSRSDISRAGAATASRAAVTLHRLAALPGITVAAEQQPSIIAVPAGLLSSSHSWEAQRVALEAVADMVQPGDLAVGQFAAQPGFIQDVLQLLATMPAADDVSAARAIHLVVCMLADGSCRAALHLGGRGCYTAGCRQGRCRCCCQDHQVQWRGLADVALPGRQGCLGACAR
uniref:Uncharacterized protein n=1 Tax=Tetradesmus obliquus TaxID=3088 RepID=A0A383V552_TETOB|eukprot:jgi/Sobl393_1/13378/SZX60735.1